MIYRFDIIVDIIILIYMIIYDNMIYRYDNMRVCAAL